MWSLTERSAGNEAASPLALDRDQRALDRDHQLDAWGGCPVFPGKQVAGKSWRSAYAKKA